MNQAFEVGTHMHCLIRTLLHECFAKCAHFPLHHFIFLHVHICLFPSPDSISPFNPLYTSTPVLEQTGRFVLYETITNK